MILQVEKVSKEYSQGTKKIEALKDIQFHVNEGETVAILGPSGSGKTTLLSVLAGLETSTQGEVRVAGENISQMNERTLSLFRAKNIGIIFQQFHLMTHLTALENVSLPLDIMGDPEAQAKARMALKEVGLEDRESHRPQELSGGECQRVAIARAYVIQPRVLLADEPSGNLDNQTGQKVMQLIFDLAKRNNMTLILVTHNEELAQRCSRQIRLEGGKVR